eukprot:TRINITY_DN6905_c0_g1_i1.p1 TRINITY_DN6905_c0_g1~~TRINITY_DN6905_c0_g1_i1.p1  ORF type:complete len:787 (-),score=138.14 TRINITY_DN6905_c0_g1_i1:49-2409(-)
MSKVAEGVEFPLDASGNRPTMGVNKAAFAAALRSVNADGAKQIDELPDRKWRKAYQKQVVEQVRHSAKTPDAALAVAKEGLDYLHKTMVFVRPAGADAEAPCLEAAMAKFTDKRFHTHEVQGQAPRVCSYTVQYKPYGKPGPLKELSGDALRKQIDTWVRNGTIELSCGEALMKVIDQPQWCDLRDTYFVLFGATSAMGPFYKLMDLGANVVAIDLDRPAIWERLLRETRGRAGKLIFPVKEPVPTGASDADIAKIAGCNLLTETPEIRTWLQDLYPQQRLICMALAYLDGALFVKVSMAMDAIIRSLIERRGAEKVGAAYLCTPTDVHLCTAASVEAARNNHRRAPAWQTSLAPILGLAGMPMQRNVEKPLLDVEGVEIDGLQLVNCVVPEQGPNYILAKRLQHWRAMICRDAGCLVSSNVAPSTATASVLSNVLFALGYQGMSSFKPMEITYQETSNAVMAALLIRDVRDPTSAANPKTQLRNPLCLFTEGAFHGGVWRGAWKFSGVGAPALLGYVASAFGVAPYLLFYSLYQSVGWGSILATVAATGGPTLGLWDDVGPKVTFFQHLGLMEVVHAALGMTRSSPVMTFAQIFSRVMLVALLHGSSSLRQSNSVFIFTMLAAWSLADFTRYVYYAFGQLREVATNARGVAVAMKFMKVASVEKADDPVFNIPYPLVWLRYSLFLVLYPLGVFSEMSCIRLSMDSILRDPVLGASELPSNGLSSWTLTTMRSVFSGMSYWSTLGTLYSAYVVGLPALFLMLLAARKKQLQPAAKDATAQGKKKKQ